MKQELTQLERLDLAARAESAESSLRSLKWILGIYAVISVVLAIPSEAPHFEVLAVRVLASIVVMAALVSWLAPWRYMLYGTVVLYVALAVAALVLGPKHPHSLGAWTARLGMAVGFAALGYALLRRYAGLGLSQRFTAVHGKEWQKERAQVQQWLTMLINQGAEDPAVELQTGNFWKGYFTYRIMGRGGAWVVARFKRGSYLRPLDYRILGPDSVKMASGDKLNIEIDKRTIELDTSPEMHASLLRFIGAS